MHEAGPGAPAVQRHLQRVDDDLGAHVVGHRPPHDPAREGVLDGGEVEPPLPGPQVGEVGDPEHVGAVGAKAALDEVVRDADAGHADRGAAALAGDQPRDLGVAHEALDALARHHDPLSQTQFGLHPPRPVDLPILGMDAPDALE